MKIFFIAVVVVIIVAIGSYLFFDLSKSSPTVVEDPTPSQPVATPPLNEPIPAEPEPIVEELKTETQIGTSVENRPIMAYHFGTGEREILFIGGIHGGYSWNTSLVAYTLIDHLKANPSLISDKVKVTVIPVLNPDGLYKVTGKSERFTPADVSSSNEVVVSGRFNANDVDLNRNFACDWKTSAQWQNKTVSGGSKEFSEPESQAIEKYAEENSLAAVVTWYSAAGGVFASNCHNDILEETLEITNLFAKASGYKAYEEFDFYATTGDMVNWFAKNNTPAISVLLTNHTDPEWTKNQAGIEAILKYYAD